MASPPPLPFRPSPQAVDGGETHADAAPEYSLLVCGLPSSVSAISTLKWEIGPVPDPCVNRTTIDLGEDAPGRHLPVFRYTPPSHAPSNILPPLHFHRGLNVAQGRSGFLFVHDAALDEHQSKQSLHHYVKLMLRYGGRGFWIVINSPDGSVSSNGISNVAARFEQWLEDRPLLQRCRAELSPIVLQMSTEDACRVAGEVMITTPRLFLPDREASDDPMTDLEFSECFFWGEITPFRHKDYLRAAFLILTEPENRELGILEIATKFANAVHNLKQKHSQIQLLPESRTLTVFWLYQVKLAVVAMRVDQTHNPRFNRSHQIFRHIPELVDEKLPSTYYSPDLLRSEYADKFWVLPDLRALVEPPRGHSPDFRKQLLQQCTEDPDRLLRFVYDVVQRYLRPGETRRRSWFINLAFASLQQQTMRMRSRHPWISAYSETQAYFFLQLVHAALSQLTATGKGHLIQEISYPLFKDTIEDIRPSAWSAHYSPQLWDSLKARASFVPPDLKPLPDTVDLSSYIAKRPAPDDIDGHFLKKGSIPELPALETLLFHQAILLEEAKSLPETLTPADVTTHAALLKYIYTNLILPSAPTPLFTHHLHLLTTSSSLPFAQIHTALALSHHFHHPPWHTNPDFNPPPPPFPFTPSYMEPATNRFIRFHNCPCHTGLQLPYSVGPDAAEYPDNFPYVTSYTGPPTHGCVCHKGEAIDADAYAAICAGQLGRREESEKGWRGEAVRDVARGEGWERWIRGTGGLVLCWEGVRVRDGEFVVLDGVKKRSGGEKKDEGENRDGDGKKDEREKEDEDERKDEEEGNVDGDNNETLDGEDHEGEDEWEVLSQQDTLC